MAKHFRQRVFHFSATLTSALLLVFSCAALAQPASQLKPYTATYHLVKGRLATEVVRKLEHSDELQWTLSDSARVLFISFEEAAKMTVENGQVTPREYYYRQSPGASKDQLITYDWENKQARFKLSDDLRTTALKKPVYDKLSYQLQLRLDLLSGQIQQPKTYDLVDRGRHKQYRIEKVGEEMVQTKNRQIHTVKLRQTTAGKDRETFIWVAPDLDYLIVRMERDEDDERIEMQLKSVDPALAGAL